MAEITSPRATRGSRGSRASLLRVNELPFETASWGRRVVALVVDWVASTLAVILVTGWAGWLDGPGSEFYVLGVFVLESAVLTALVGGSFGQIATRLRVVRTAPLGRPLDLLRALGRQVLVALVIPPLVFRPDGRGLHDIAVGSVCVRLATLTATQR